MAIFQCKKCNLSKKLPDEHIGKSTKCPNCQTVGTITIENLMVANPAVLEGIIEDKDSNSCYIRRCSGGSIQTPLGYGIVVNKESSIQREWITVIHPFYPVELVDETGVKTIYEKGDEYSSGNFYYQAQYKIKASEPIQAIELRFLLFNIWGMHEKTLSNLHIQDMKENEIYKLDGKWNIFSENEVSEYYASIAFVAQVRTSTGKVLVTNTEPVLMEAMRMSAKFSEADLEPTRNK
jgi:hypothetical protein